LPLQIHFSVASPAAFNSEGMGSSAGEKRGDAEKGGTVMKTLIPWRSGENLLDQMRTEMDGMFQRFFGPPAEGKSNGESNVWAPRLDISETDKAFVVKADLPGVDPKDVEINIRDGVLTVQGEKKEQKEEKHKNYHRIERFFGEFYRSIPLPTGVDEANVQATSAKGVLTLTIPKKPEAQPKKIVVKPQE
jgi:HSP20 family protein